MARPAMVDKGIPVTVWLDQDLVDQIDRIGGKIELSRSRFVRNLIAIGLEDAKLCDALGLLTLMRKVEGMRRSKIKNVTLEA